MATLESYDVVKQKVSSPSSATNSQYNNLNLNQNQQSVPTALNNSSPVKNKEHGYSNHQYDNLGVKESSFMNEKNEWGKSSNMNFDEVENDRKKGNRNKDHTSAKNSSSQLSLHISAYENSIVKTNFGEQTPNNHLFQNVAQKQNPFELARQQPVQNSEPLIMQFKSSQKLADTNPPPPPPPPPPSSPVTEENFYNSLTIVQKQFFDQYKEKNTAIEKELFDVKMKLDGEKRWNSELLDDRVPLNILKDKYEAERQSSEAELNKLKLKITRLEEAFSYLQVSTQKAILELKNEVSMLKRERAVNESRTKYMLDFYIPGFDDEFSDDSEDDNDERAEDDEDYVSPSAPKKARLESKYDEDTWRKIVEEKESGVSFKVLQKNYKKLKYRYEITRMKTYLAQNGTALKKFYDIDTDVLDYFLDMREKLEEVHDRDLVDAALRAAVEHKLPTFKASKMWLHRFKKKYRIVSRKINARVTLAQINDLDSLEKSIEIFRKKIKEVIYQDMVPLAWIFNADQTGIKMEMTCGRTLTFKGEKKVEALVQRVNATTHSYTAQVVINAEGELMLPMLVTFCEPNKPQCFEAQLAPFKNIKAVSTKSGMMTSELGIYWLENIFKPNVGENAVLVVDSWNGYVKAFEQDKDKTEHHILPPKSTGTAQPLDVFFMRMFKNFIRTMTYKARRENTFTVSDRRGMATILDITVGQFTAPIFRPMIQYSWFAAGYLDERPEEFETPVTVCFDSIDVDDQCSICEKWPFIKCAHCMEFFCFEHSVKNMHCCYN